jgi:hypothetical protein
MLVHLEFACYCKPEIYSATTTSSRYFTVSSPLVYSRRRAEPEKDLSSPIVYSRRRAEPEKDLSSPIVYSRRRAELEKDLGLGFLGVALTLPHSYDSVLLSHVFFAFSTKDPAGGLINNLVLHDLPGMKAHPPVIRSSGRS